MSDEQTVTQLSQEQVNEIADLYVQNMQPMMVVAVEDPPCCRGDDPDLDKFREIVARCVPNEEDKQVCYHLLKAFKRLRRKQ